MISSPDRILKIIFVVLPQPTGFIWAPTKVEKVIVKVFGFDGCVNGYTCFIEQAKLDALIETGSLGCRIQQLIFLKKT